MTREHTQDLTTAYDKTIAYLYGELPMYQRVGPAAYRNDLSNITTLCNTLGNPQRRFRSVHIAGTNGKGSVAHALASILMAAGYKTGLYTSPHLRNFEERIRINGVAMPQEAVVRHVQRIRQLTEDMTPSFFEMTVAMAFAYFAEQQVDVAVVEVGMGGRLDATNLIVPEVSVITNISYDHQAILGNSLQQIAAEKAGIMKAGVPVVVSEKQDVVTAVFSEKAKAVNCSLTFASDLFDVQPISPVAYRIKDLQKQETYAVTVDIAGPSQARNLTGVLAVVDTLVQQGYNIHTEHVQSALKSVLETTGLRGRWQTLSTHPLVLCDTAHNIAGVTLAMQQLLTLKHDRLWVVWGMVGDKDPDDVLALLPKQAHYIFCQSAVPRAMPAEALARRAETAGLKGVVVPDVKEAYAKAMQEATANDVVFIGGSTYVVGEIPTL